MVVEYGIPVTLLEATTINSSNTPINIVDADLVWPKPDNRAMFKMRGMQLFVLAILVSNQQNPRREKGRTPMSVWDTR
jgi:hypothetical protein